MKAPLLQRLAWALVGRLGALFLRALFATIRLERTGKADLHGKIIGLWHQQFALFAPWAVSIGMVRRGGDPIHVMVSDHRDGEYLARVIHRLGGETVRGDSRRKPVAGLKAIVACIRRGAAVAFAMDGPVGPAKQIKPGIVAASLMTGKPIVLVFCAAERKWTFHKAWDRFFLPKPFTRAHVHVSACWFPDPARTAQENTDRLQEFARREEAALS